MPDGRLLHLRDTYPIETAWAPQWVGDELRQVRAGAREAVLAAARADWEAATRAQRHLAVAADAELRRRASGAAVYPAPFGRTTGRHGARRAELTLTAGPDIPDAGPWIKDLAAGRRRFAARLADRQSLMIPAEDPDYGDLGQACPAWTGSSREAILQPPKPQIRPRPASWSAPRTARPTSKPGNDSGPVHPGREGPTAIVARMMMDASKSRRRRPRLLARIITGIR
jgi:hypothetical protein